MSVYECVSVCAVRSVCVCVCVCVCTSIPTRYEPYLRSSTVMAVKTAIVAGRDVRLFLLTFKLVRWTSENNLVYRRMEHLTREASRQWRSLCFTYDSGRTVRPFVDKSALLPSKAMAATPSDLYSSNIYVYIQRLILYLINTAVIIKYTYTHKLK